MTPVLAMNHREFRRFLNTNQLSENKYVYISRIEQLYGVERGSILLMFESFKANTNYHELITLARHRNLDCIRVS